MTANSTNIARAARIRAALIVYAEMFDAEGAGYRDEPLQGQVSDLLTDIMHFCDVHAVDFSSRLAAARAGYAAEVIRGITGEAKKQDKEGQ